MHELLEERAGAIIENLKKQRLIRRALLPHGDAKQLFFPNNFMHVCDRRQSFHNGPIKFALGPSAVPSWVQLLVSSHGI
ncbi:MAG TPA: hypothetical protein VEV20_08145 [Burkholderiales bacterium]|nr:hypothetical protein [Burkholderiales bacterium]